MKNLESKKTFLNRHTDGLPSRPCLIEILVNDSAGEHLEICSWTPFDENNYIGRQLPAEGYLGTAKGVADTNRNIGWHAWQQNNSEFIYYKLF